VNNKATSTVTSNQYCTFILVKYNLGKKGLAEEVESLLHKKLKSKKGISPILATLLLIVIAVAAVIVTYAWVMTFTTSQTSAGGTLLDVENISWNYTAKQTSIVVKNIGTSDAKILRLYAGTSSSNLLDVTASTDLNTGKLLPVNQRTTLVLNWPNALVTMWTNGTRYYFRIAPEIGTPKDFNWQAPSA